MQFLKLACIPLIILNVACKKANSRQYKKPASYTEIVHKSCTQDTLQQYEIYIPKSGKNEKQLPVIFLFDSHADGKLAINKFKEAAEIYGFMLVASDNSKNGVSGLDYILKTLVDDATKTLSIDPNRQYAAGFSGGGRVAAMLAMTNSQIKGIITCGAGFSPQQASRNVDVCAIVGKEDFNYDEVRGYAEQLKAAGWNATSLYFDGGHAWPPSKIVNDAVLWLQLNAMKNKVIDEDDQLIDMASDSILAEIENNISNIKLIRAEEACLKGADFLKGLENTEKFEKKLEEIRNSEGYKAEKQTLDESNYLEQRLKEGYIQAFTSKDTKWWNNELHVLQSSIEQEKNPIRKQMLKRIKAFLGIVCFSYSNKAANEGNMSELEKFVSIYEVVEPENSDCYFYKAVLMAKKQQDKQAKEYFKKAQQLGFHDMSKAKSLLGNNILEK